MKYVSKPLLAISVATILSLGPSFAQSDHPLISSYPGSKLSRHEGTDFAEYQLVTGYDKESSELTGPTLRGTLTRNGYYNPKERSVLEVYTNYEQALKAAGAEVLFTCVKAECAPSYASSKWNRFNGISTFTPRDARYIAARLINADGKEAYVAIMVGEHRHSIDILEVSAMDQGLVVVDADALGKGLDARGWVIVEGIFFDTDKAELKPESKPALDEVAALLEARPQLKVYVVGHTDMTGTLDHNMALSADRARSVVKELVNSHGIAAGRLEGHGVGPLAPQASNSNDGGRARNRRVVLVVR